MRCISRAESTRILEECHASTCGDHYSGETTTHKIVRAGYYWLSLFKDAYVFVRGCDKCQRAAGKLRNAPLPLNPVFLERPFAKWALDFVGPISPTSSGRHAYILTITYYFMKWAEASLLIKANSANVISVLSNDIFTHFGVPTEPIADNGTQFTSAEMVEFYYQNNIFLRQSSIYYPQGNGLAESTNKTLIRILKKTIRIWEKLAYEVVTCIVGVSYYLQGQYRFYPLHIGLRI